MGAQEKFRLERRAVRTDLGETRGDDHEALDALATTCVDHREALCSGDGEDGQLHLSIDRFDVRRAPEPKQRLDVRIDRVHQTFEATVDEIADDGVSDTGRVASRADDGDGRGLQESGDALHAGGPGARSRCKMVECKRVVVERQGRRVLSHRGPDGILTREVGHQVARHREAPGLLLKTDIIMARMNDAEIP